MNALLIIVHVVSCIVLILVVLLQAGRGADMGAAFGGASTPMFGSGSSTNPLARMTTITAIAFLTSALLLAVSSARRASVFDSYKAPAHVDVPVGAVPAQQESPAASSDQAPATPPVGEAKPLTIPAAPGAAAPGAGDAAPAAAPSPQAAAPQDAPTPAPARAPAGAATPPPAQPAEQAPPGQ
ncbi:MAG TPA: preprotein translocase subunit SecG [Candidatus Binatia bacterium]|jgi:preprotein translocase subunit SecG